MSVDKEASKEKGLQERIEELERENAQLENKIALIEHGVDVRDDRMNMLMERVGKLKHRYEQAIDKAMYTLDGSRLIVEMVSNHTTRPSERQAVARVALSALKDNSSELGRLSKEIGQIIEWLNYPCALDEESVEGLGDLFGF